MKLSALSLFVFVCAPLAAPAGGKSTDSDVVVGGKTCVQWLKVLAEEKDLKVRRLSLTALEFFGARERGVVPALIKALQDDQQPEEIRRETAALLGRMGADAKSSVVVLGEAVTKDKSPGVREAAAKSLGGGMVPHSKAAVSFLVDGLTDKVPAVRAAAAASLKDLGAEARLALPQFLEAVKDKGSDRFTQVYLLQLMGKIEDEGAKIVPAALALFNQADGHLGVREAAAECLARFPKEAGPAVGALTRVFEDAKAPLVLRRASALALAKINPEAKAIWPAVKAVLTDPEESVRIQAVRLAGMIGRMEKEATAALVKRFADVNTDVRIAAIQEVGELGAAAKEALSTVEADLQALTTDSRASVREAAEAALKKIKDS